MAISILLTKSTNFVIYTFYNSYMFNKIIFSFSLFSVCSSHFLSFFHEVVDDSWYRISLHFFECVLCDIFFKQMTGFLKMNKKEKFFIEK